MTAAVNRTASLFRSEIDDGVATALANHSGLNTWVNDATADADPGEGRSLTGSSYTDDDGSADPAIVAALTAFATDSNNTDAYLAAAVALANGRLLVPVVAVLGEIEYDEHGHARDKSSDMAAVLMTGTDGRRALLAFTSVDTLRAWRQDARPVPVSTPHAAATAVAEGAAALMVDIAGPVPIALEGEILATIAAAG